MAGELFYDELGEKRFVQETGPYPKLRTSFKDGEVQRAYSPAFETCWPITVFTCKNLEVDHWLNKPARRFVHNCYCSRGSRGGSGTGTPRGGSRGCSQLPRSGIGNFPSGGGRGGMTG